MKFKLDENFGSRTQELFRAVGHSVDTVRDEALQGCSDRQLFESCRREARCLVTMDLDFADVVRFPPAESGGLVVVRPPRNLTLSTLEGLIQQFLSALTQISLEGQLWIVEPGRIRIHQGEGGAGTWM